MSAHTYAGYTPDNVVNKARTMKKPQTRTASTQSFYEKETVNDVLKYPIVGIPHRGFTRDMVEFSQVRSKFDEETGEITASYYPYPNKQGELVAFKKRDWTVPKEDDFHFTVVGNLKQATPLYGQMNYVEGNYRTKRIYITEGEEDRDALYSVLKTALKESNYSHIEPVVVGLPLGTANAMESIAQNESFVRKFESIVLAFDADSATAKELRAGIMKGKEATEAVAGFLLSDNIFTIPYPEGKKDSRECLTSGLGAQLAKVASFCLEKYSPESVCSGDDSDLDDLLAPLEVGYFIERFPKLMDKIQGLRTGNELITYAAFSGVGKSTLAREIGWELTRNNKKVGFIFLEEPMKKTQQSLLALELGVRLSDFRKDPLAKFSRDEIAAARSKVLANGNTFFLNHFGSMKVSKLMQQVRYLHHICGCGHVFIDHISMVVAGNESQNERKDIDMLYEELATFMTINPCTVHAVMHLKRVEDVEPKVKEGEEPKSYWRKVKKEMLRGSAGAEQMSSTIIVLENEVLPDGRRGRVRSKVEKNREWSDLGVCDTMMQDERGRLQCVPEDDDWMLNYYASQDREKLLGKNASF